MAELFVNPLVPLDIIVNNIQSAKINSGVQFKVFIVPLGTTNLNMSSDYGLYVLQSTETLPTTNWNLPSAIAAPGTFFGLINKSTTTTVTIVPAGGDTTEIPTLPPSGGVGMDFFFPIWSDGINAWVA
jgi:hypothetical protein